MCVQWKIERFLRRSQMSKTRFGRLAVGDPRLVQDLRDGREPGVAITRRIEAFLAAQEGGR
jgi:hypothetical protein